MARSSQVDLYKYNWTTIQYDLNYSSALAASDSSAFSFIASGEILAQVKSSGGSFYIDIYTFNNITGSYSISTTSIDPATSGTKTVHDASLEKRNSTYVLITTLSVDTTYYLTYRTITSSS